MTTDQELLQAIAAQLRQPRGAKGIEMADMMHQAFIQQNLAKFELRSNHIRRASCKRSLKV